MSANRIITNKVLHKFSKLCDCSDCNHTDAFIVTTYLRQNKIEVKNNKLLLSLYLDSPEVDLFIDYLEKKQIHLSLEDLVSIFEFVVSPSDKEVNGAVYTPLFIREYIVNSLLERYRPEDYPLLKCADLSCGCGGFLLTLARYFHEKANISYQEIFRNCLFGVDIEQYCVNRAKLLLTLLAISTEDVDGYEFNFYQANSLSFDWNSVESVNQHGGFDIIVGNPPYVGASKIDKDSLALVKQWPVAQSGKADMYIPFFQIAIENLVDDGYMGYITVNNFYRSVNGRCLRQYFSERGLDIHIIDFGSEQIFKGRSTYTCLCFIRNTDGGEVNYLLSKSNEINLIKENQYIRLPYENLNHRDGWVMCAGDDFANIRAIRETGIPLGQYTVIKNGFATLKNDVYIFTPFKEDDMYYYLKQGGYVFPIEKRICRPTIKGNTLRSSDDITAQQEKIIFPYHTDASFHATDSIAEDELSLNFPMAYHYLLHNKQSLENRSKSIDIKPWYAFGRSQALDSGCPCLLFPYIADSPYFILCTDISMLFYNGYALINDSIEELLFLQKLLTSRLFWYYIMKTSKPYGGNFYALAKNYVKSFGIPILTKEEKQRIIDMPQECINQYIERLYNINLGSLL